MTCSIFTPGEKEITNLASKTMPAGGLKIFLCALRSVGKSIELTKRSYGNMV